jgi:hypothetical protein
VDVEHKLVFFWTPRCASNTLLAWFFHSIGWGERLRTSAIHDLRREWLKQGAELLYDEDLVYREPSFRRIVVSRDPYLRAVSSYYGVLVSPTDSLWSSVQGRRPDADELRRLTFAEFLDFLEEEDLQTCNLHWRLQSANRWWRMHAKVEIFRVETLEEQLTALGREFGMEVPILKEASAPRFAGDLTGVDIPHLTKPEIERLVGWDEERGMLKFPEPHTFLVPECTDRLTRIYAQDIEALGYERR